MTDSNQYKMQDPRSQYSMPTPEINDNQPEPGLDSKLEPKADHGENTYIGSGRRYYRRKILSDTRQRGGGKVRLDRYSC